MTKAGREYRRRKFLRKQKNNIRALIAMAAWGVLILGVSSFLLGLVAKPTNIPEAEKELLPSEEEIRNQYIELRIEKEVIEATESAEIEPTATPEPSYKPVSGKASYYSWEGCIGCRDDRLMANGEILDDKALTVAYNRAPLNSFIQIEANGNSVTAKVTDRGGFERHGKIVDLSVATKNALGCGDVCNVMIYEVKNPKENKKANMLAQRP